MRIIDFLSPKVAALLFFDSQVGAFAFAKISRSDKLAAMSVRRYISLVFGLCCPNRFICICTVPFKCKLTVSTRNSILDTRYFRESRIEFRGLSFEFQGLSLEYRVSSFETLEEFFEIFLEFVTIEINNTALPAASFICARVHLFHISVQIVSLEVKF